MIISIINYDSSSDIDRILFRSVEELDMALKEFNCYVIASGISDISNTCENLNILYKQALWTLRRRSSNCKSKFLYYNDIKNERVSLPINSYKSIVEYIETGNIIEAECCFEKLYAEMVKHEDISAGYAEDVFLNFYQYVFNYFNRTLDYKFNRYYLLKKKLDMMDSLEEMKNVVWCELQGFLNNIIQEGSNDNRNRIVSRACRYISENYTHNVSMEMVAEYTGVSYSYFSQAFKKETGINYSDYIIKFRVEKAKELLKETNLTIEKIAEKVGFVDSKHFSKVFKKLVGIPPKRYSNLVTR
jgi:two-component system response regulator YesN